MSSFQQISALSLAASLVGLSSLLPAAPFTARSEEPAQDLSPSASALNTEASSSTGLTRTEAIRLALTKNYALRIEALSVPVARANLTEARGLFDPRFKGSYSNSSADTPSLNAPLSPIARSASSHYEADSSHAGLGGLLPWGLHYDLGVDSVREQGRHGFTQDVTTSYAGLTITQPLLRDAGFGPSLYGIRVARTNHAASEWDYRQALTDTITQVLYACSELEFQDALLRTARRSLELATRLQDENRKRFAIGAISEFDVNSAEARVASRREGLIIAELGVKSATNELRRLISDLRTPELLTQPLSLAPTQPPTVPAADAAADFHTALALRPDFQKAALAIKRGTLDRDFALNQLLPNVDLIASTGVNGFATSWPAARSDLRSRDFKSSSAGISVSIPLSFTTERGRFRAARLRREQAEFYLQKLEQDILISVGNAATTLDAARRRTETTALARKLNDSLLEAELRRLRAGTGSTFSVLYQQEQLNYAEISEALALHDLRRALAEYDRQTGRTLATHHIALAN